MTEAQTSRKQRQVFFTVVIAQFCGTSLWFAGNAILPQLQQQYQWPASALGFLTSFTLFGFIVGTLAFAMLGVSDKFSPSKVFFFSSIIAAGANAMVIIEISSYPLVLVSRFTTGFFLAGIYPVGMKIAADWKPDGLGHWLGGLVGALVLGTSFPHGLRLIPYFVDPVALLIATSLIATSGGVALLMLVPDGPFRKPGFRFTFSAVTKSFSIPGFRSPAFGYFGHMWELYAFWAFVPWILTRYQEANGISFNTALFAFLIIGSGSISCLAAGRWSLKVGSARVAVLALSASGFCCLLSPLMWSLNLYVFTAFMVFWGVTVIADSAQCSALVARNAPAELKGSAITLSTCIGFAMTIVTIQLLNYLQHHVPKEFLFLPLLIGPVFGVVSLYPSLKAERLIPDRKL